MIITKNTAYALMVVAVAMWATSGPFAELAYREDATVIEVTTFAFLIGALVLLVLIAIFDRASLRIRKKDLLPFIGFSLVAGVLLNLAWFGAIDETSVAITVVLNYTYPSMVTVASVFLFKEKFTAQKALALPLTFAGCILVAGGEDIAHGLSFNWYGIGLGLASGVATAVYYLWGKKFEESYSPNTVVLYLFAISTVFLVVVANPIELVQTSLSASAWFWILNVAIWSGVVGFLPSLVALKHLEASKASIVASIEPVFAVVLAFIMLAEGINAAQVFGVALVVLGVALLKARIGLGRAATPV